MANITPPQTRIRSLLEAGLTSQNVHSAIKRAAEQSRAVILQAMKPTGEAITLDDRLITLDDDDWPNRFEGLPEQGGPWWLWTHGQREHLNSPVSVAIVGTRRATADGLKIAYTMAKELGACGITVISGMANGIDQAAHRGCLDGGGTTVGVLGCGLDVDYPKHAGRLKDQIVHQGCLVSEQAPTFPITYAGQFLERNRIIAALADAVVVIEAKARSGALNTAGWAGEYNRECLVVPASPNHPGAAGSLALIRDGCQMVRHADDVLEALGIERAQLQLDTDNHPNLRPELQRMYQLLSTHPTAIESLAEAAGMDFPTAMMVCGELVDLNLASLNAAGVSLST